jgi:hypothetical protein
VRVLHGSGNADEVQSNALVSPLVSVEFILRSGMDLNRFQKER